MKSFVSQILVLFVLLLFTGIAGCQTTSAGNDQSETLSNSSWELTGINNRQVMTASMGNGVYITFEPMDNRVSGFAGCNRFFGNYRFDESGSLTFDGIGSTRAMCNNISVETEFLNALRQVNRYERNGATLRLFQQEKIVATFTKIPYRR